MTEYTLPAPAYTRVGMTVVIGDTPSTRVEKRITIDGVNVWTAAEMQAAFKAGLEAGRAADGMRHSANEWADMAINGIQWLRNTRDGISTMDEALASLAKDLKHCQDVASGAGLEAGRKVPEGLAWAVEQWQMQVSRRPLVNKHRRALDDVWRQVIRHFGGDPITLIGLSHDELLAAATEAP